MKIGIDIGGTSIKIGLVENETIIKKSVLMVDKSLSQNEQISAIGNLIKKDFKEYLDKVTCIGIASPGVIDRANGICVIAPNLNWHNAPVVAILKEMLGKETKIINDANAACLAELELGIGRDYQNFIMITIGTGIGAGIVRNHTLYEGKDDSDTELGHLVMIKDGNLCKCGKRGCVEAYCSATALIKLTKEYMEKNPNSLMWKEKEKLGAINALLPFITLEQGDETAKKVIDEYTSNFARAIKMFSSMYDEKVFVLGGGVSLQKDNLINRIQEHLQGLNIKIVCSKYGNDSGIIGATLLF